MLKQITVPPSYALEKKGKVFLILRKDYRDFLLQQGIEDIDTYLGKHGQASRHLGGRAPHPSIPIKKGERMVLRHYSHGGLLRFMSKDLYLFGSRSFQELALTEEIRSMGIPTVQPIGAIQRRVPPFFYQAYLLTQEIPDAKDGIQYLREIRPRSDAQNLSIKRKLIRDAGLLIRRFHEAGFFHGDLQLRNLLIADDHLFLIDFDRAYRRRRLSRRERLENLLRLNRSVDKWSGHGLPITLRDRWRFFLAYAGHDADLRHAMRKALRAYSIRSFLHRWSWKLQGRQTFLKNSLRGCVRQP
jgi:3-deoxy-D-manno-octulosonic acid kinase